jgi:DHA1 family inner membrane transport protein
MDRKRSLATALLVFVATNLAMAFSSEHYLLSIARFVSGAMHGLFVGVASVAATELVSTNQRGRAMSMVFGGNALATVLGVPAGTYIAQLVGWRACFIVVAALALVSRCATFIFLPGGERRRTGGFVALKSALAHPVLAMPGIAMLVIGGQFSAFAYMAPYLKGVTRASAESIGLYLLLYGAAGAAGMFAGGTFADRNSVRTLIIANQMLVSILATLYSCGTAPLVTATALAAWGSWKVGCGACTDRAFSMCRAAELAQVQPGDRI